MKVVTGPEQGSSDTKTSDYQGRDGAFCRSTVVVGLGNDLLSDDGVGLYVARRLRELLDPTEYEIRELSVGGIEIVEQLIGHRRAVVIDACRSGRHAPGTLTRHRPQDFSGSLRLGSFHTMNFATALELARMLGAQLPEQIDVYAIEAEDTMTLSEHCTPAVEAGIERIAGQIARILRSENEATEAGRLPSRLSD